ncbi:zinc-binding domain-containing protein [Hypoxylon sp. NC0597]|nr:zinc-binding domain-containing protein [Hypoxylon sp. NC0597]
MVVTLFKMARRAFFKPKGELRASFMYPSLHQRVLDATSGKIVSAWFNEKSTNEPKNEYSTHVMGKFKCNNDDCSKRSWGSKKVAILIRGYPGNGYNAVVFNQRCQSCNQLGTLTLDENSYVERVAYRLKKWAGVPIEKQHYDQKVKGPPHKSELCEGCNQGYCQEGNDYGD